MFEIIPSPGTDNTDWHVIEEKIERVKSFAKTIHIDVVDGKFANNKTFSDPNPFKKYTSEIFFEVHLMVEEPLEYIEQWAAAGFKRFIGQVEKMSDQIAFVAKVQQIGEVGLAIDGSTSLDALKVPVIDLDTVLIMTIQAGFSGQDFQEETLKKVMTLAEQGISNITVDGGINERTIEQAYLAGARRFVTTSALFKKESPKDAYRELEDRVKVLELREAQQDY